MTDTTLKDQQRIKAAQTLGWRKDATKEQEEAVLAYLLPLLNDAKTRSRAAVTLQQAYVASHGLWHKDQRVLEAVKAALAAEQAQPQPDKAFTTVLEKIIKGQQ
jgi:hypothetical protein